MPTITEVLTRAIQLQQASQLDEAENLYRRVLEQVPSQPDALHLLGLVRKDQGRLQEAANFIQLALKSAPDSPVFLANLGVVRKLQGRLEEAEKCYRDSIAIGGETPGTLFNLGKTLRSMTRIAEAKAAVSRSISLKPSSYAPWLTLMNLHVDEGDLEGAIVVAEEALQAIPQNGHLLINKGVVLKKRGETAAAIECFRQAKQVTPNNTEAIGKLAVALAQIHQIDEASRVLEECGLLGSGNAEIDSAFGFLQATCGDYQTAESWYRKVIAKHPKHASALFGLANALRQLGRLSESLEFLEAGLTREPENAEALISRGVVRMSLGMNDDAQQDLLQALHIRPESQEAASGYLLCSQYSTTLSDLEIAEKHQSICDRVFRDSGKQWTKSVHLLNGQRPRIGFVSADLGNHPVGYFTVPLFEHWPDNDLEAFVYSDRIGNDLVSERIRDCSLEWKDVRSLSNQQLSEQIKEDRIDCLFDLSGHTGNNRLATFAARAAPTQITWAGYVGTTGLSQMDFILADGYHIPSHLEHLCRERVLRLADDYICFDPPNSSAAELSQTIQEPSYAFGAFANPAKINPLVAECWSRIAERTGERFLLCYTGWTDPGNQQRFLQHFRHPDLVEFRQVPNRDSALEQYRDVRICLDTFPYSGGLTTCEALWMGVPTITFPGNRFCSRHSFAHLSVAGLSEFIVRNISEYEEKAVEAVDSIHSSPAHRSSVREQVAGSPLCDAEKFAESFYETLRGVLPT
ncbi:MAG: tetratricopeptide repeat protein [Aureliella sp.]